MGGNPRRTNGHRRDVLRARVLSRGDPCWVCGLPIDPAVPNLHPCQGVVDELVPVSQGGSPYHGGNCAPAHRCCNNWRKAKPVSVVRQVQAVVAAMGGASTPQEWCALARRVMGTLRDGSASRVAGEQPITTTDW